MAQLHPWHTMQHSGAGGIYLRAFGVTLHEDIEAECVRQAEAMRRQFVVLNGREPTPRELRDGLQREFRESIHVLDRRANELAGPKPPPISAEEDLVIRARERVAKERYEKLTPDERLLVDAEQRLAAKQAAEAAATERQKVLASPAARRLIDALDRAIQRALIDPHVDGETLAELRHQKAVVLQHATPSIVESVSVNVRTIQEGLAKGIDTRAAELKSALDVLEESRQMLTSPASAFDSIAEKMIGQSVYIQLTKDGQSVSVSKERWEARTSDEALAATLFPTTTEATPQ